MTKELMGLVGLIERLIFGAFQTALNTSSAMGLIAEDIKTLNSLNPLFRLELSNQVDVFIEHDGGKTLICSVPINGTRASVEQPVTKEPVKESIKPVPATPEQKDPVDKPQPPKKDVSNYAKYMTSEQRGALAAYCIAKYGDDGLPSTTMVLLSIINYINVDDAWMYKFHIHTDKPAGNRRLFFTSDREKTMQAVIQVFGDEDIEQHLRYDRVLKCTDDVMRSAFERGIDKIPSRFKLQAAVCYAPPGNKGFCTLTKFGEVIYAKWLEARGAKVKQEEVPVEEPENDLSTPATTVVNPQGFDITGEMITKTARNTETTLVTAMAVPDSDYGDLYSRFRLQARNFDVVQALKALGMMLRFSIDEKANGTWVMSAYLAPKS